MIPFATCMRLGRARRTARPDDGAPVEWRVQHPADVEEATAAGVRVDQTQTQVSDTRILMMFMSQLMSK